MALATTTLSSAAGATDNTIVVASATSFAAGRLIRVDDEWMQVGQSYVAASTTVPVLRGRDGSVAAAHVITTNVVHGLASDFSTPSAQTVVTAPRVRARKIVSITATPSTLTLPSSGEDLVVILNSTAAITLTIPVPTNDMDGSMLVIISNGVAAHVPTFTGGFGGVGAGYTAFTVGAGAKMAIIAFAVNGAWNIVSAPAWTGTVTKITGGIA